MLRGGERRTRTPAREGRSAFEAVPVRLSGALSKIALSTPARPRSVRRRSVERAWWEHQGSNLGCQRRRLYRPLDGPSSTTPLELHLGIEPSTLSQRICSPSPSPVGQCSIGRASWNRTTCLLHPKQADYHLPHARGSAGALPLELPRARPPGGHSKPASSRVGVSGIEPPPPASKAATLPLRHTPLLLVCSEPSHAQVTGSR